MLRIGFAFNQKPLDDLSSVEDEPPGSDPSADRFAEWDDASTIDAVEAALKRVGTVIRLEANHSFPEALRTTRPDIVFNIAEGLNGPSREAQVPAICEFYGIPYTASDPATLCIAHDKARAKEVLLAHGVPTPAWSTAVGAGNIPPEIGTPPWIVKPVHEGSSMGICASSICHTLDDVAHRVEEIRATWKQPALIEEFLTGREFTVGIIGNGSKTRVLPLVEIRFDALPKGAPPLYGHEAKWVWDSPAAPLQIFACPADVAPDLRRRIEDVVLRAYHALGCRDWARVDVRLDATGAPNVIELNPLPGILPDPRQNSCLPKAARAAGIAYDDLILHVLRAALERYNMRVPESIA
jgi:D-alanine-D-alanine ligase